MISIKFDNLGDLEHFLEVSKFRIWTLRQTFMACPSNSGVRTIPREESTEYLEAERRQHIWRHW
jgi:hypothetical protein